MTLEMIEIPNKNNTATKIIPIRHLNYLEKATDVRYNSETDETEEIFHYYVKVASMKDRIVISEETYNKLKDMMDIQTL